MPLFHRPGLRNHDYGLNNVSEDNKGIATPESNSDLEEVYATSYKESGYLEKEDLLLKQILEVYYKFLNMFRKIEDIIALPEPSSNDYVIPLKDGKEPLFLPIYQMSETNLVIVKKYIDNILEKGFI